ncbi:MAG: PIN domain-containing protein [Alphaproteobacteria bacterium]
MYVFDTAPLSTLFKNYYRNRFPTLWERFDALIDEGHIVSTREVLREVRDGAVESLRLWAVDKQELFFTPTAAEAAFIAGIYGVAHFQQNIEQKKLLKGGRNADPFVIAKAATEGRAVVTMELFKQNGVKIPNICGHFGVPCLTLEAFMEQEGWAF